MRTRQEGPGSRYLYDSFDVANARIEANERVAEERWVALEYRLNQIETMLERVERRIWIGLYGVAGFLMAQTAEALVASLLK